MSVAELAQRSGRSVSQLVELAFGSGEASTATPPARGPGRPPGAAKGKRGKAKGRGGRRKAAEAPETAANVETVAPKPAGAKKANVDTRAASGRAKYDETVLAAIRNSKSRVKAADLRTKLGGTPLQIRSALHRLLEDGQIKSHGKARGTTYAGV